jgi:hypothetical protein
MRGPITAVATTILLLAGFPTWAGAFHGERVYIANHGCTGHAYKPWGVTLACGDGNLYATGIAYKEYGQKVAVATASIHLNDCIPYCAAGHFHSYRGTLSFRAIVRCDDGRLYYSRARYKFTGPYGSGDSHIAPFEHCSGVLG